MNLLPEEKQQKALEYLIEDIKSRDWHLSTGFVGLPLLLPTLTRFGQNDVAYLLLNNDTFPSWGYEIKHGATTIWERWDGWTEGKGFYDPTMNSFNHYAFGSVGEWLYSVIGGIETDDPGFKKIIIKPLLGGGIAFAKTSYNSINGQIITDWRIENKIFHLNITIPVNTTATVYIPVKDSSKVKENNKLAHKSQGVEFLRMGNGFAVYRVASGSYQFVSIF